MLFPDARGYRDKKNCAILAAPRLASRRRRLRSRRSPSAIAWPAEHLLDQDLERPRPRHDGAGGDQRLPRSPMLGLIADWVNCTRDGRLDMSGSVSPVTDFVSWPRRPACGSTCHCAAAEAMQRNSIQLLPPASLIRAMLLARQQPRIMASDALSSMRRIPPATWPLPVASATRDGGATAACDWIAMLQDAFGRSSYSCAGTYAHRRPKIDKNRCLGLGARKCHHTAGAPARIVPEYQPGAHALGAHPDWDGPSSSRRWPCGNRRPVIAM